MAPRTVIFGAVPRPGRSPCSSRGGGVERGDSGVEVADEEFGGLLKVDEGAPTSTGRPCSSRRPSSTTSSCTNWRIWNAPTTALNRGSPTKDADIAETESLPLGWVQVAAVLAAEAAREDSCAVRGSAIGGGAAALLVLAA